MGYLDEVPTEKLLKHLLQEARPFVRDAGDDECPEAQRRACELLEQIDKVLRNPALPSASGSGEA